MDVPVPRPWVAGEVVTATDMNSQVYRTTDFLLSAPACAAYNSSALTQQIPANAWTEIQFDAEEYDNDEIHSNTTPSRFTFRTPGLYLVNANLGWSNRAEGARQLALNRINASDGLNQGGFGMDVVSLVSGMWGVTYTSVNALIYFRAGDQLSLIALHNASATLSVNGTSQARMNVLWVAR